MNETFDSNKIKIVGRATFDLWLANPTEYIDETTVYFIIEPSSTSSNCLSLYVGTSRQTDMINLPNNIDIDNIPTTIGALPNKLYYSVNELTETVKLFIKSTSSQDTNLYPIEGNIIWQSIET